MNDLCLNWHLFCRVIDNYGDIGVCWRLCRQLHEVHGQQVVLWVDDLHTFHAIEPQIDPALARQEVNGIGIRHWSSDFVLTDEPGDVVVETFACDLPEAYINAMQARVPQPVWINLEYLSAEDWVIGCHGCPSPVHGMNKSFFFPGFMPGTGGLLFDQQLPQLAQALAQPAAKQAFLAELGVPAAAADSLLVSLFAYENPALAPLLDQLSAGSQPVTLLVPQGRISADVAHWLATGLMPGPVHQRGALRVASLPFMSQEQYDRLLALCDINFVRGEESFVRAQMLGKPMVWHIYQQEEDAHLVKLEAFLALHLAQAQAPLATQLFSLFRAWNQPGLPLPDMTQLLPLLPHWQSHARDWQQSLLALGDLASNLVHYARNRV